MTVGGSFNSPSENSSSSVGCPMAARKVASLLAVLVASDAVCLAVPRSVAEAGDYSDFISDTISSHPIVIFSKSYCPFCTRVKAVFQQLKKSPFVLELDIIDNGRDIHDALIGTVGKQTVPQVFINGKHIGGSDDTVAAYNSGELHQLLDVKNGVYDL